MEDNRGRHIDNPGGSHSIRTNQQPTSIIPQFLHRMPFLLQPLGQASNMLASVVFSL